MMWVFIIAGMALVTIVLIGFLINRFGRFGFIRKWAGESRRKRNLKAAVFVIELVVILLFALGVINTAIVIVHLGVIWILCDLIAYILTKIKINIPIKGYLPGIFALVLTTLWLAGGWYLAHHVWEQHYTIDTEKEVGTFRVVQFADSHVGTTFHGAGFAEHVKEMQACDPDIVVINGDFVDDDTTKEDMIESCAAFAQLHPTYGVYYSFGNHDKGYYGDEHRGYSGEDLIRELEKNGVQILQDETVLIDDRVYLIGRQDRSEEQRGSSRESMEELVKDLDPTKFSIVLDHQPHDYKAQAACGVDLVLSGHTHGGQFFPINYVGEWLRENDKTYGHEVRDNTHFIVTSGISDWAIKFKTGCRSEFVVVDIKQAEY